MTKEKEIEALDKIDNTLCLNNNIGNLEFGIDTEECSDCNSAIEMTECLDILKQAITDHFHSVEEKARAFGKDIIILDRTLKQTIDKPIFYASRYGNKYIVPQELFEKQCNALNIIGKKNVDIRYLKDCKTVEEYNKYCDDITDEKSLTKEEFDLLVEMSRLNQMCSL